MKTIINVEEVEALLKRKDEINSIPLEEIEWHENDKPIEIPAKLLDDWRFIGLGNMTFVELRYWEDGVEVPA